MNKLLLYPIALFLIELLLLIKMGASVGALYTLLYIVVTAAAGVAIIRYQGTSILFKAREQLATGRAPIHDMSQGFMLVLAGCLLVLPGILLDTVGAILLLPQVRRWVGSRINQKSMKPRGRRGEVLEGEFERHDKF